MRKSNFIRSLPYFQIYKADPSAENLKKVVLEAIAQGTYVVPQQVRDALQHSPAIGRPRKHTVVIIPINATLDQARAKLSELPKSAGCFVLHLMPAGWAAASVRWAAKLSADSYVCASVEAVLHAWAKERGIDVEGS